MKSIVCVLFLALFCGKVSASSNSSDAESEFANGNDEPTQAAHQLVTNSTSHSGRIVNGYPTSIEYFPYIVRLRVNNIGICGANVITYTHALTAAHCVYNVVNPSTVTLYGGSTSQTSRGVVYYASKITVHPKFNYATLFYDAAIIQVQNSFIRSTNSAPIALQDIEVPVGTSCTTSGWGLTSLGGSPPDTLYYVSLGVVSNQKCSNLYGILYPSHIMCASQLSQTPQDTCSGDSGGPLVCNGKLTGITSFGDGTCQGSKPAGFTKVSDQSIRDFIRSIALF